MFGINKKTEEMIDSTKKDIKEEIKNLIDNGQVLAIGVLSVACLSIGYILGSITTGAMCKAVSKVY